MASGRHGIRGQLAVGCNFRKAAAVTLCALLLGFVALYGAYFAWRYEAYGHLYPNTYYVKVATTDAAKTIGRITSVFPAEEQLFVRNRIAMQDTYMEEIHKSFPDVRAVVPLFEQEVRGLPMLKRTAEYLFG